MNQHVYSTNAAEFFRHLTFFFFCLVWQISIATAGPDQEEQLGAWYMIFWSAAITESNFGFQGDIQYRNWNLGGDLQQLLLRGGVTYTPNNTNAKFTLGYGYVLNGAYGESNATSPESRIYQEALLPQKIGSRVYLNHRFRYEQRWLEGQDFRTRYRYVLFLNVPFNQEDLGRKAIYLALYNEIFLNGQREIGQGREVEIFDRDLAYAGLGYFLSNQVRVQVGYMLQTTDLVSKPQLQLSAHLSL